MKYTITCLNNTYLPWLNTHEGLGWTLDITEAAISNLKHIRYIKHRIQDNKYITSNKRNLKIINYEI